LPDSLTATVIEAAQPQAVPVCRPRLPGAADLAPYLRRIDATRVYSNYGPLHDSLLAGLSSHFAIAPEHLALANSGTSGLIGLILAKVGQGSGKRPLCICPSYTFVATAVAARNCGYTPFFADVGTASWMLDPAQVERLPQLKDAALVIAVAAYGRMPDIAAWEAFADRTGVPVIIDAAACFDTIDAKALAASRLAAVISLHATKTFSTAEGGLIIGGDTKLIYNAAVALNFGFDNSRNSTGPSINGKLSEYHAAIGLAELEGWAEKRQSFITAARHYARYAASKNLAQRIITNGDHANPYALYVATDAAEARAVMADFDRQAIGHRLWYGSGLHRQTTFGGCPSLALAATEGLAPRLIGLPMAVDLDEASIKRVVESIARVGLHA